MSTIYEALKKAESKTAPEDNKPAPAQQRSNPKLFLLIFTIVALVIIALIHLLTIKNSGIPGKTTPSKSSSLSLSASSPTSKPSKAKLISGRQNPALIKKLPAFSLTGIFFSDGEYIALINDQTVKVGDSVEGAQIKKIESNGVEVEFEGSSFRINYP